VPNLSEKERTQIINALRQGVVPIMGLWHIQVGREQEVKEIAGDLQHIGDGGSRVRFVSGDFGTGKSFFLTLAKLMAHEKKLVVLNADITTDRILCAADGKARALLTELLKNMSHKSKPERGGLKSLIETWIGSFTANNPDPTENSFYQALSPLSHLTLCQDFCKVLFIYLDSYKKGDLAKIENCMKWFRAEYENKTEAKKDLGVSRIIEDSDFQDVIKLYAGFCSLAGFGGMLVTIDEVAVLTRQRAPQRNKNYEAILTIINDCMTGSIQNLGFIFGATSEAIQNKEKGLYSYGALESRLAKNEFAKGGITDLSGPVIPLTPLSREQVYVLLTKLRGIFSANTPPEKILPDDGIQGFLAHIFSRMGADANLKPREIVMSYLDLLAVLGNNPDKKWSDLLGNIQVPKPTKDSSDDLVKLKVG
jgi:hypothetical protein